MYTADQRVKRRLAAIFPVDIVRYDRLMGADAEGAPKTRSQKRSSAPSSPKSAPPHNTAPSS